MTFIRSFSKFERSLQRRYGKPKQIITVSGLAGVGKSTLAKKIAKKYKLKHVSLGQFFRKEAKRRKMSIEEFLSNMEKMDDIDFDVLFDKRVLELAYKSKRLVIEGRLSGVLLGNTAAARLWVDCNSKNIAKRLAKRERESAKTALKDIKQRNRRDVVRYRRKYKINFSNEKNYNIFIDNTESLSESLKESCFKIDMALKGKRVHSIAISGRIGSGKSTVAKIVAKKLKFRYISGGGLFRPLAREIRISVTQLLGLCKREKSIHYKLDRRMVREVKKGRIVADGKLIVWHSDADLKVFLTASKRERARRIAKREQISFYEGFRDVTRRDRAEKESFTTAYPRLKFTRPPHHILIDTTTVGIEKTAKKILKYAK